MESPQKFKPQCSFCGKGGEEVKRLIAGPACYICEGCVALCCEIVDLDWERLRRIERAALKVCEAAPGSDAERQLCDKLRKALKP